MEDQKRSCKSTGTMMQPRHQDGMPLLAAEAQKEWNAEKKTSQWCTPSCVCFGH